MLVPDGRMPALGDSSHLRSAPGENSALPLVLWEEGLLPPQGEKTMQAPAKGLLLAGLRGTTPPEQDLHSAGPFKTSGLESQLRT